MPSSNFPSESVAKQLFLEQAAAYFDDMKAVADNAPDGHVVRLAETFAVTRCH